MSIISIGALDSDPAAIYVNNRKVTAVKERYFSKLDFPTNALKHIKPRYETVDAVAITNAVHGSTIKNLIEDQITSKVILVNGREALVKSALVTNNNPTECAILLEDEWGLALGYYANNKVKWLKQQSAPLDLQTFLRAVTNLNSLSSIDEMLWSTYAGSARYKEIIETVFLKVKEQDIIVHPSVASSNFVLSTDPHITHSAITVFKDVVATMLQWLKAETQLNTLAIVGDSVDNFLLMESIDEFFSTVIVSPSSTSASRTLGAAAILEPFDWYDSFIGVKPKDDDFADKTAHALLDDDIVTTNYGAASYSNSYLGNRSVLCLPIESNCDTIKQQHNIPRFEPLNVFVCEKDYDRFFEGKKNHLKPTIAKVIAGNYHVPYCKVTCTNPTSNPFMNRVLEITRVHNYPIIVGYSRDLANDT